MTQQIVPAEPTRTPSNFPAAAKRELEPANSTEVELYETDDDSSSAGTFSVIDTGMNFIQDLVHPGRRQAEIDRIRENTMRARMEEDIVLASSELYELSCGQDGTQAVIMELNQKGGTGKSPLAASSAVTIGHVTEQTVAVIDNNQVAGNTVKWLDIIKTIGIREAILEVNKNPQHASIIRLLGHHPGYRNVYGIDSDLVADRRGKPIIPDKFDTFLKNVKSAFHTVIIDNGNEVDNDQTIVAARNANVLRFVAIPWMNDAVRLCKDTMDYFRIVFPKKVADSVIVINACNQEDMDIQYWADYFSHPVEQISLIPYDPIFKPRERTNNSSPEREVWAINHYELAPATWLANIQRDILTLKQAKKYQDWINAGGDETKEQKAITTSGLAE